MNGHHEEAKWGVDFLWVQGRLLVAVYLGRDYRISSVRYYGNGRRGVCFYGPNVETDDLDSTRAARLHALQL